MFSSRLMPPGIARFLLGLAAVTASLAPSRTSADAPACNNQALFGVPTSWVTGPGPLYVAAGDFNEDGIVDLAVTNSDFQNNGVNSSLVILIGTGPRTFAPPVAYTVGAEPHAVTTGDFNEDGITDLVVANKFSSNISILLGRGTAGVGNGTFAPAVNYPTGGFPFQIVAEDLDRDGITDIAVSLNNVAAVNVLRGLGSAGTGNGTFASPVTFPLSALSTGLERGDFNHDGILDLVATENGSHTIAVLIGTGVTPIASGSFAPAVHYGAGTEPFEIAVADFNGDGNLDLAVANTLGAGTVLFTGIGNGTFQQTVTLNSGNSVAVAADDLDQDGILDLVIGTATGTDAGNVRVYIGQGNGGVGNGSFWKPSTYSVGSDTYQVLPGDFDGDGRHDLLVSSYLRNFISLLPGVCTPDTRPPVLTKVRDVPADQGGKVFVTWKASSLDATGGSVNNYRVWRRVPEGVASSALRAGRLPITWARTKTTSATGTTIVYWEALATLPAQRLQGYGYTSSTTSDSMTNFNPYTAFFITALTSDIDVFYSSNVDSGYSVDNLAPVQPAPFVGVYSMSQVSLHWTAAHEADFARFRLYRGSSVSFVPGPSNLLRESADTAFVDYDPAAPASCYKLSATDLHGNESMFAVVAPNQPTPVQLSLADARADAHGVHLAWYWAEGSARQATAYKMTQGSDWAAVRAIAADGTGQLRLDDDAVTPGARYGYRLGFFDEGIEQFAGETWIDVPALALALGGAVPNPSPAGRLHVQITLATSHAAMLQLTDVAGRVISSLDVGSLGPGKHEIDLSGRVRSRAGIYFLRLTQDAREVRSRVVVLN